MAVDTYAYTLIETSAGVVDFAEENKDVEWLCFDTEFIGEKRYVTLICLIQVATEHGLYLIDPLKVDDMTPFFQMLEDEQITKITHAGENDYRLLHYQFDITPKNVFDAQVAAGFVGYKYPVSFRKLVESEVNVRLAKGYAVTDWEARPFREKQLRYALNDVIHLPELWRNLSARLEKLGRLDWVIEECSLMENPAYYAQDPNKEALNSNIIHNVKQREQVFLLRLFEWRRSEAERKNYSKEMVLQGKLINQILRAIGAGRDALMQNRRLPERVMRRYADVFMELYKRPATEEELSILKGVTRDKNENPEGDILIEMLHLIIRNKCLKEFMAPTLVVSRNSIKRMKNDPDFFDDTLETTWRRHFIGEEMTGWFKHRNRLEMQFGGGKFALVLREDEEEI